MIRVLHLTTDSRIAGAEKLLIGIGKEFDSKNFETFFCTMKARGVLHERLEKQGNANFSLNCRSGYDLPQAMIRLGKIMQNCKVDILHTHLFHACVLGQFVARFNNRVIPIMTKHYSNALYLYGTPLQRLLDRSSSSWARHIIAISSGVRKILIDLDGVRQGKITVIHNGIELPSYPLARENALRARNEFSIKEYEIVVGTLGSLHPRKGYRYLIEAMKLVFESKDNIKLMMVGEGVLRTELKHLSEELGIEDKVIFTGYREDVNNLLSAMDIVVQPSIEEGFGIAILEAMALGKIVIATNVGGIPEIINNGETGMLVPCANAGALAKAISFIIERPDLSKTIAEKGRKSVEENFNIVKMVRGYENLYKDLLDRENRLK